MKDLLRMMEEQYNVNEVMKGRGARKGDLNIYCEKFTVMLIALKTCYVVRVGDGKKTVMYTVENENEIIDAVVKSIKAL